VSTFFHPSILQSYGIPVPEREYKFHPTRKWKIDFAWPAYKFAVEIEGGVWTKGRHIRGKGFSGDMEKYNNLAERGWTLLRYVPTQVGYSQIVRTIDRIKSRTLHRIPLDELDLTPGPASAPPSEPPSDSEQSGPSARKPAADQDRPGPAAPPPED